MKAKRPKLSPNQKKYVRNLLRSEGYACECGAQEVTITDEVFVTWGSQRHFVVYTCVTPGCNIGTWRPFDGPVPEDPGVLA